MILLVPDLHCCQFWYFSHSLRFTFKCVILAEAGSLASEWHPAALNPHTSEQTYCYGKALLGLWTESTYLPQTPSVLRLMEEGAMRFTALPRLAIGSNDKPWEWVRKIPAGSMWVIALQNIQQRMVTGRSICGLCDSAEALGQAWEEEHNFF